MPSLQVNIDEHSERLGKQNAEISRKKCEEILQHTYKPIKKQLLKGFFQRKGGYQAYLIEREKVKVQYHINCKWLGADEVYAKFVDGKMAEQMQILSADKALSDSEKHLEETEAELE